MEWFGIELSPLQVNQLTAMLAALSASTLVGVVTAAVGFVLATIVADLADDYYGTRSSTLELPSSGAEALEAVRVEKKSGWALPGGRWRLATDVIEFKGQPGAGSAAAWDGIVEIRLHWEASAREIW